MGGKVFGIGWAKTGTTTLGRCFELLGYDHQSARLDLVPALGRGDLAPILEVAAAHESFEDWPWPVVFRELDRSFPGSRFVLTTRRPDSWLRSYRNMLANQPPPTEELLEVRRILYGLPFPDVSDEDLLARVAHHEREVLNWFADRPESLLVVDWANGDGWDELCGFLGCAVPSVPFPHQNRGVYGAEGDQPGSGD